MLVMMLNYSFLSSISHSGMRTNRLMFFLTDCYQTQANQVDEWHPRLIHAQMFVPATYLIMDDCTKVKFMCQAVNGHDATAVVPLGFLSQFTVKN